MIVMLAFLLKKFTRLRLIAENDENCVHKLNEIVKIWKLLYFECQKHFIKFSRTH